MSNFFEVKNILKKRTRNAGAEYLVEWANSRFEKSWVKKGDCNCNRLIKKFEKAQMEKIVGKYCCKNSIY